MSEFHHSDKWKKIRAKVMRKQKSLCANPFGFHSRSGMITKSQPTPATEVHHKIPIERCNDDKLQYDLDNLIALCPHCHSQAHRLLNTQPETYCAVMNINVTQRHLILDCKRGTNNKILCRRANRYRDDYCRVCKCKPATGELIQQQQTTIEFKPHKSQTDE